MSRAPFYLFIGFFVLIGVHWLFNLPRYILFGSKTSPANALSEIDLRNIGLIKKAISQEYKSGGIFALITYVGGRHNGADIAAKYGAPIHSPVLGKVVATGNQDNFCYKKNYGKFMVIENSEDGAALLFAHLSKTKFNEGDIVENGDVVAITGSTGRATAPHLHLTVFKRGTFKMVKKSGCGLNPTGRDVNPLKYLEIL